MICLKSGTGGRTVGVGGGVAVGEGSRVAVGVGRAVAGGGSVAVAGKPVASPGEQAASPVMSRQQQITITLWVILPSWPPQNLWRYFLLERG